MPPDALTVRLSPELIAKLGLLARDMGRDPAAVAIMAIETYIDAWQVQRIREALDEDQSGTPGVPHEEVMQWLESWGTENELPRSPSKER
jgi:predicted transcriptional regulator